MQEFQKLTDLRSMSANFTQAKAALTLDEAVDFVQKEMQTSEEAKLRETGNSVMTATKNKAQYRQNFAQYFDTIKAILMKDGVRVFSSSDKDAVLMSLDDAAREITAMCVGQDCLEDAMQDDAITDIYCISYDCIFVEKNGVNEKYPRHFRSAKVYKNFCDRILRDAGKSLDNGENKIVDFELYGNRGNIIIDTIATKGICLTMRKHSENPIQLKQMVDRGLMTQEIADMLGMFIEGETNLIYAGITGSGKTTTIRALLDYYISKLNRRILVLEDTQELFLKNPHTVDLATFHADDPKLAIGLRELNISALRMKPKYIIVGEVRGAEAESAVEGMETGHSTIFTMHGGNVWNVVNRLVTKYLMQMPSLGIDVVERIIGSAVNFVCIQDDVPGVGRRLTSCYQISYDFKEKHVKAEPIILYDFKKKTWIWRNTINEDIANVMTRRGVAVERVDQLNAMIRAHIKEQEASL